MGGEVRREGRGRKPRPAKGVDNDSGLFCSGPQKTPKSRMYLDPNHTPTLLSQPTKVPLRASGLNIPLRILCVQISSRPSQARKTHRSERRERSNSSQVAARVNGEELRRSRGSKTSSCPSISAAKVLGGARGSLLSRGFGRQHPGSRRGLFARVSWRIRRLGRP